MKKFCFHLALIVLAASCGQDYNSNTGDYGQYAPIEGIDSSSPDGTRLLAAYKVLQTKCFQCHNSWSNYKSSAQWVASGVIAKGNSSASLIYTQLKNNGGNMPPDPIASLTSTELSSIENWIDQIP